MIWFWLLAACAQCGFLYLLARTGRTLPKMEAEQAAENRALPDENWPTAALIIPVAGEHPSMAAALKSLLRQDYPRLLPILVTATAQEPAARLIRHLQKEHPAARHVVAGKAQHCGQKNHNTLQGVAAAGNEAEVFVFCDSTHLARPDFVRCLAGPIARGEAAFSTGYHMVDAKDQQTVTLAYAFCVLLLRLLQALSAFTQPWGGAMAMSRSAFREYGVADLWAHNVVDDCSLAGLLLGRGVHVRLCPGALLRTEAVEHALPVWREWMERQVLFLKFCVPGQWLLLGLLALLMALPPLCAGLALLGGLLDLGSGAAVFAALLYLAVLAAVLYIWRGFLAVRPSLWRWIWACVCASGIFVWVYCRSIPAKGIIWHGLSYTVGQGGTVLRMQR